MTRKERIKNLSDLLKKNLRGKKMSLREILEKLFGEEELKKMIEEVAKAEAEMSDLEEKKD